MKVSTPYRLGVVLALAAGLLGLGACGRDAAPGDVPADSAEFTDLGWEAQALETVGFSPSELAPAAAAAVEPAPTASAKPGREGERNRRWKRVRFPFRHVLHAEGVVQTDEGTKTVVVQRGEVTAITSTSMTVRSTDGFTLQWTLAGDLRVVERRGQVQPSAVAVGAQVGVAGAKDGAAPAARLIVIRHPRTT